MVSFPITLALFIAQFTMSEEQLKLVASSTINGLFSSGKVSAPISSMDLLSRVISVGPPAGLLPTPPPRFRLIDLPKFESILDSLSQNWDHGLITLARDDKGITIMDVNLDSPGSVNIFAGLNTRKRKRVVDEDADSAAGSDDGQDSFEGPTSGSTTLGSLSKELKEVYTILQKSTAKGRLLAEQVCRIILYCPRYFQVICSINHLIAALNQSAPKSLRTNARSTVVSFLHLPPPLALFPQFAIAFTFALFFAPILTQPWATAHTSILATLNRPMPNHPPSRLFHLIILVRVL